MYTLRSATVNDLPAIHSLLDHPLRNKLLIEPLAPLKDFLEQTSAAIELRRDFFYLLEKDSVAEGLIRIMHADESCEIWGKALSTLYYHCGRIAFEELKMKRLQWYVRKNNRRMVRICELFGARKTGEEPFLHFKRGLAFISAGVVSYYSFTPESYREHIPLMRKYSLPIGNFS